MPGHVDEDGERARDENGVPNRVSVEAVGEIDRVARADDHEIGKGDEEPAEVEGHVLDNRHDELQLGHALGGNVEEDRSGKPDQGLQEVLAARGHAAAPGELSVVVEPADAAEPKGHRQNHPHEAVREIRPQHGGHEDGEQDEDAAHGGGARLGMVRLGTVLANDLAEPSQAANRRRTDREGDEERGQHPAHRAQGDVPENSKAAVQFGQHVEERVQHRPPSACTTLSIPIEREPLTSTVIGDLARRSARSSATSASCEG